MNNIRYTHKFQAILFIFILIYYWFMLNIAHWYVGGQNVPIEVGSPVYLALVLPIFIFMVPMWKELLIKDVIRIDIVWLLVFGIFVLLGSLVKGDLLSTKNFIFLILAVGAIIKNRLLVSTNLLNVLYLLSVVWCVLLTMQGVNEHGFIPVSSPDAYADVSFRISLFPHSVVGSALFSLVVIIANVFGQASRLRPLVVLIALYFILLSGARSVLICLLIITLFFLLQRFVKFQDRKLYQWMIPSVFFCFIFSLDLLPFFAKNKNITDSAYRGIIFHGDVDLYTLGNIDRLSIWRSHLAAWLSSPIVGVLPQDLVVVHNYVVTDIGTESFLTRVAAQTGMGVIFLLLFFRAQVRRTLVEANTQGYVTLMVIAILSISYGSFIGPTDFIFLVMISIVSGVVPSPSPGKEKKQQIASLKENSYLRKRV